jgi:Xaa-Pro aminopeptidase
MRLKAVRRLMRAERLNALIVSSPEHVRYLTGFSGSHGIVAVTATDAVFITDPRYKLQSAHEVRAMRRVVGVGSAFDLLSECGILRRCRIVGFEAEYLPVAQYRLLRRSLRGPELRGVSGMVEAVALVKDAREKALLARAASISDAVFRDLLPTIRPGVSEREVAARISWLNRMHGAEDDTFPPLVASGTRSALPHGTPTMKRIHKGELVTIDFGSRIGGYGSDMTRTIAVGKISARLRSLYDIVREALDVSFQAARGGIAARELDRVARAFIERRKLGRYFVHALGHGIGLHTHERPRVSPLSTEVLMAGSVITLEPGIYIAGLGGVRIEDDVVLGLHDCRLLTRTPRELTVV